MIDKLKQANKYWIAEKTDLELQVIELVEESNQDCKDQVLKLVDKISKMEKIINIINNKIWQKN